MQRKSDQDTYRPVYFNPHSQGGGGGGRTYFTEVNAKLENMYVTKTNKGKFSDYAYKVGEEYQLAVKRGSIFALDNITLKNLNEFRKGRGYTFKVVGERVVFDKPLPEFEPVQTFQKRTHEKVTSKKTGNEKPKKMRKFAHTMAVQTQEKGLTFINLDLINNENPNELQKNNDKIPVQSQEKNFEFINVDPTENTMSTVRLQQFLFQRVAFNTATQKIELKTIPLEEIKEIKTTKLGNHHKEFALPFNDKLQLVIRGRTGAKKFDKKTFLEFLSQKHTDNKPYLYKILGDTIIFSKRDGSLPALVPISNDVIKKGEIAAKELNVNKVLVPILHPLISVSNLDLSTPMVDISTDTLTHDEILDVPKSPSRYLYGFFYSGNMNQIEGQGPEVTQRTESAEVIVETSHNILEGPFIEDDDFINNLLNM